MEDFIKGLTKEHILEWCNKNGYSIVRTEWLQYRADGKSDDYNFGYAVGYSDGLSDGKNEVDKEK